MRGLAGFSDAKRRHQSGCNVRGMIRAPFAAGCHGRSVSKARQRGVAGRTAWPGWARPDGWHRQRILTLIAVWCCLGGCASRSISFDSLRPLQPYDSTRNSITALSSGVAGGVSLPHRDLIRVDFTSGTDLRNLVAREGNSLFVHSYFCDRGDKLGTLGDPGVYVDRADAGKETLVKRFLFFLDVSRKSDPGSIPPEPGFDLSTNPQDICFYVTAQSVITTFTSQIGIVPKASIEQVFTGWKLH
jgi:hypothetical protein